MGLSAACEVIRVYGSMNSQPEFHTTESKYPYSLGDEPVIRHYLDEVCLQDQQYPEDRVNSIYFDTRDRRHLAEKVDSDYVKMKVRIRWYGDTTDLNPEHVVNAFLEVKIKNGVRRKKTRQPINVRAGTLNDGTESFDELMQLAICARECGWVPCGQLYPAMAIHYDRVRYLDPQDWARLALDRRIAYQPINLLFWPDYLSGELAEGVLEVKSQTGTLPRALWPIRERLCMRDAFSKYEECWLNCTNPFYQRQLRSVYFD